MGPGPDDMVGGCGGCCSCAGLDDGIMGGICSVCRCNIAYKCSNKIKGRHISYEGCAICGTIWGRLLNIQLSLPQELQ